MDKVFVLTVRFNICTMATLSIQGLQLGIRLMIGFRLCNMHMACIGIGLVNVYSWGLTIRVRLHCYTPFSACHTQKYLWPFFTSTSTQPMQLPGTVLIV